MKDENTRTDNRRIQTESIRNQLDLLVKNQRIHVWLIQLERRRILQREIQVEIQVTIMEEIRSPQHWIHGEMIGQLEMAVLIVGDQAVLGELPHHTVKSDSSRSYRQLPLAGSFHRIQLTIVKTVFVAGIGQQGC